MHDMWPHSCTQLFAIDIAPSIQMMMQRGLVDNALQWLWPDGTSGVSTSRSARRHA